MEKTNLLFLAFGQSVQVPATVVVDVGLITALEESINSKIGAVPE